MTLSDSRDSGIEPEHLCMAFRSIKFIDAEAYGVIKRLLIGVETTAKTKSCYIDQSLIDIIIKYTKNNLSYSSGTKIFIKQLEKAGFGMDKTISALKDSLAKDVIVAESLRLKKYIEQDIVDQPHLAESIADAWMKSIYHTSGSPRATFLFAGASSTGKSTAAMSVARALEPAGYAFCSFQMSSYTSDNQQFVIDGLSRGYNNAKEGELTAFVRENPYSVILFEGIDKTHHILLEALRTALDSGKIMDKFTLETIDFTKCVFIFETNGGAEIYNNHSFMETFAKEPKMTEEILIDAISRETKASQSNTAGKIPLLPYGFLSRMRASNAVLFRNLTYEGLCQISAKSIEENIKRFGRTFGIKVEIAEIDQVSKAMVLNTGPKFEARSIKNKSAAYLLDAAMDVIRDGGAKIEELKIILSESTIAKIKEIESDNESDAIIRNMYRKSMTLQLDIDATLSGKSLTVTLVNPELSKIKQAKDFEDGGFVIDLPDEGFDDIAGHEEVKTRLREIVRVFTNRTFMQKYGEQLSKGILLYGPPGTGKTMLARAFAKEADLPFIATTGNDLRANPSNINKIFKRARNYAPSIVFIDEIDVFKQRDGSESDMLVNMLLTAIDGFSQKEDERIFVFAATNMKEKIDGALLRSGRIDIHVEVGKLDRPARKYFIDKMLSDTSSFASSIDADEIVRLTVGLSGADLDKLERECIMCMFREKKSIVDNEMIIEQINTLQYGPKSSKTSVKKELEQIAYHEAGHAIASMELQPNSKITQVTISPRRDFAGMVAREEEEAYMLNKDAIINSIKIALAGRVSEIKKYGKENISSGAANDILQATRLAHTAVGTMGMDDELANCNAQELIRLTASNAEMPIGGSPYLSEKVAKIVERWLADATRETTELIDRKWDKVEKLANALLANETLSQSEIQKVVS